MLGDFRSTDFVVRPQSMNYAQFAVNLRRAIVKAVNDDAPGFLQQFPSGCCGWAAIFAGSILRARFDKAPLHVFGRDYSKLRGHEWIEVDGTVIDVTLDQFGDQYPQAYAGEPLSIHRELTVVEKRSPIAIETIETEGVMIQEYYDQIQASVLADMIGL